jgi:hypothetical protein
MNRRCLIKGEILTDAVDLDTSDLSSVLTGALHRHPRLADVQVTTSRRGEVRIQFELRRRGWERIPVAPPLGEDNMLPGGVGG